MMNITIQKIKKNIKIKTIYNKNIKIKIKNRKLFI